MSVHYKFKSTLDYDTVSFDGLHISVADLKKAIFHQKRIGKNTDFDLQITNAQTKEDYTDDNALIAKNTSLIVARVPLTVQQKRSWDRNEQPAFANSKEESNMGRSVDLTRLDGSEEDKIRAMMTQSTQDYDPSNYMKIRGANQTGEVPPNYRCYKCHQPGHWIKNCPSGVDREPIEIKKSTGIPRSFMVPVEGPLVPGAMMTPTGHYAVPAIDHQAYKEGKKERPPFAQDPEPAVEKPEIPEDLLCNICKDLLTDAVMIPCCGNSFCDECIRTFLLESEEHECPDCNEKDVSPETLIPNRFLRNAVMNFKNETGYAKRKPYRQPQQPVVKLEKPKIEGDQPPPSEENNQTVTPSQPPSASNVSPQESTEKPADVVEPVVIQQYEEPPPALIVPAPSDSPPTPEIRANSVAKLTADEETEVPPPPGTEPLLPIPALGSSPDKDLEHGDGKVEEKKDQDEDYSDDQRPRERRRSFSKDSHRERSGDHGRRMENLRTVSRRRSLSPRNSQRGDYPPSTHSMNHPASKNYQVPPPGNGRYQSSMHYCGDDRDIRRSTEERPDTPTVDEPHLHGPPSVSSQQPPLLPYPPGEDRLPAPPSAPPPQPNYNQPPPNIAPHNALLPDPYMTHRIPLYPHQQGGPHYGPPRYDRPPYQQSGYRGSQIPRNYNGPPRPMRGMHHLGYRGVQPPPPGLGRNVHNGNPPGVIDDPLEAFERMLREKDERDRRLGKHRRRSRTRSRSRSYTRSRSRSFGRRSPLPARISRSRSPPPKRRASRSPLPLRQRSRTPKRRSRSGSFSISRSRSYSRSQSPRGSLSRDRERERERERERDRERDRERERDLPPRYRSPVRSPPPRFHRERERERPRSREPREAPGGGYNSYYNDSPAHDYGFRERERELPPPPRERPGGVRYPPRNHSSQHPIPPLLPHLIPSGPVHPPPPLMSLGPPPPDRKDYYDSYNRYTGPGPQRFGGGGGSPLRDTTYKRPFDDVAPPGTEGYYDLPPPGVDHPEKFPREDPREKSRLSKEHDERERVKDQEAEERERLPPRDDRNRERDDRMDRGRERDDRVDRRGVERERDRERDRDREEQRERPMSGREHQERIREKEERERREKEKERDDRHLRDRREEERQIEKRDYEKERYRDERERHRIEDKGRGRERERKERDYEMDKERERHERYEGHSVDRKKVKKSSSPHPPKSRNEMKDPSPERTKRKDKEHEERAEEKKKEKKIKEKKKKKDGEEKEKKKKKKKEKRSTQKEIMKEDAQKVANSEVDSLPDVKAQIEVSTIKVEEILRSDIVPSEECVEPPKISLSKENFEDKSLAMNPEPPDASPDDKEPLEAAEFGTNPPNPNFKPIPEIKENVKPVESLYDGLDDTEVSEAVILDKYSLLTAEAIEEEDSRNAVTRLSLSEGETTSAASIPVSLTASQTTKENAPESDEKSPKKDEFLAQLPELSKWEREDTTEKFDVVVESPVAEEPTSGGSDESKSTKVVTSEVLKRAENAIFQKAINAIRPIEIKKISESRKILYQNPEPKIIEPEPVAREIRKSVNVTINVGRNERNVEITEPIKKAKLDRTKFKPVPESHSPTRLSAKDRLGDKVDDEKERKPSQPKNFLERRDPGKSEVPRQRSRSPRTSRDRRPSPLPERRVEPPPPATVSNTERKVFLDDRKRERERNERPRERTEGRSERHEARSDAREVRDPRIDNRLEFRSSRNESRSERTERERGEKERDRTERRARTPPAQTIKREDATKAIPPKRKETPVIATTVVIEDDVEKKKEKKPKEEKKRKKEHRSRSKSKDRKRRKEKKHKRDKEKSQEKKQKHKDSIAANAVAAAPTASSRDKLGISEIKKSLQEAQEILRAETNAAKKQRKNPRLVSDRKRSVLDEANFEPDYSASDSDSEGEEGKGTTVPAKKPKLEGHGVETATEKLAEVKLVKKRVKSTSSEDYSTSDSDSSSSDTDSSEDSHRKRKKKHKKHKKRKSKKESSSESDSYSDSSYTSSDDRHKKKSKKSKSRSKQAKKKKKARHK